MELLSVIAVDPAGVAGAVDGLDLSAEGSLLAASDNSNSCRLYDLTDPRNPRQFGPEFRHVAVGPKDAHSPAGEMNAVALSPDARWLAGGVDSHGLMVWGVATGEPKLTLDDGASCDGVAFSPDGKWLASAAGNRLVVRPFDSGRGEVATPMVNHEFAAAGEVNSVSWLPDARGLAAGGPKRIEVFERSGSGFRLTFTIPNEGRSGSVKSVRVSPDAKLLAMGARDERARVFDAATGGLLADLPHEGNRQALPDDDDDKNVAIEAVAWSSGGDYLFTSGLIDGLLRVWRRSDWALVETVQAQEPKRAIEIIDVAGDLVAVGGDEGVVRLYRFHPERLAEREALEGVYGNLPPTTPSSLPNLRTTP